MAERDRDEIDFDDKDFSDVSEDVSGGKIPRRYPRRRSQYQVPEYLDWKDADLLRQFIPERGKIMPDAFPAFQPATNAVWQPRSNAPAQWHFCRLSLTKEFKEELKKMATTTVLLREDIDTLGGRGEIVKVKAGYARNYLLPQGLASLATKGNLKQIENEREALLKKAAQERSTAEAQAAQMSDISLTFERKVGETGHLFGSVTSMDIVEALKEKGYEIDRRKVSLKDVIKETGEFTVPVKLHREVTIDVPVKVTDEEGNIIETEEAKQAKADKAAQAEADKKAAAEAAQAEANAETEEATEESDEESDEETAE